MDKKKLKWEIILLIAGILILIGYFIMLQSSEIQTLINPNPIYLNTSSQAGVNPYYSNPELANYKITIDNGLKISYKDSYSVTFIPYFVLTNGNVLNWSQIPSNIQKDLWKTQIEGNKYKYGVNFNNLTTTQKNLIRYVVLFRSNSTGLTWDDVRLEGNTIIIKNKVYLSHDDILSTYSIPLINKTHIVIGGLNNSWTECLEYNIESLDCINSTIVSNWKSNPDGTWNISFDPTITISESSIYTTSNLINVTAETGSALGIPNNFTHLNMSTESPYNKLTLYYPFDGDVENDVDYNWNGSSNSHTVYDFSSNDRNGITQTRAYINSTGCLYGDCVHLDGNSTAGWRSNVKMPNAITFTGNQSITFMIWAYPGGSQNAVTDARLISGGTECVLRKSGTSVEWILNTFTGATDRVWSPANTFPVNTWTHVTGMYNNVTNNMSIFINGLHVNSTIPTGTYGTCTLIVAGGTIGIGGGHFNGSLDEIMIFNDALTDAQILAIYNNQSARFYATGTQDVQNINVSTLGTENRVNITLYDCDTLFNSNLSGQIGIADGSGTYNYNGSIVNFSSCIANSLTVEGNPNNVSLRIGFLAGTNQFYSPLVIGNITLDSWYEAPAGGDTTPPSINFTSPTPSNGSIQPETSIFVNVSADDSSRGNNNISTFIDFDGSLVAWWRMDDTNGSGDVVDYTGRYNLTKRGDAVQTNNSFLGKGFNFTNTGNLTTSLAVMTPNLNTISFGGWIKWDSVGNNPDTADAPISQGGYYIIADNSNNLYCGDGVITTDAYPSILINTWYYVMCIHNSTNMILYVDGIERKTILSTANAEDVPFSIGNLEGTYQFNGSIDDVMIFNRSLSAGEIAGLYANTTSRYLTNNFTSLAGGTHTFKAYSQDTAGNINSTETRSVIVTGVADCGYLDGANTVYTQTANIIQTANADCIVISAQNITFNGNGYSINQSTSYDVIYSNQYNTTVKNCNLTGSGSYGINLNGANNSYIFNNTIKLYGSGIRLNYVSNTIIENNTQSGSTNAGIYLINSNNNIIQGNSVTNNYDYDSSGINLEGGSNNNTITNNILQSNGNQEIKITGDNNTITNNNMGNCSTYTSVQVCIEVIGNNNIFSNNKINNSVGKGIVISGNNTLFKNTNMTNIVGTSVSITNGINNTFLNFSYYNESVASGSQLIRKWYYQAYVNDTYGNNVSNANITAYNTTGSYNFNLTTDSTGYTELGEITDYVNNGTLKIYYSNYTIYAINSSYATGIHTYNATEKQNNYKDIFTLNIIDIIPPIINFTPPTPLNETTTSNTSIEINVSIIESSLGEVNFNWNGTNYTIYNDSLVLMFNFENLSVLGENTTRVVDLSKYGNNGTIFGATLNTSGKYGSAYQFDGINNYIRIEDSNTLDFGTSSFSYSFWFNNLLGGTQDMLCKHNGTATEITSGYRILISTTSTTGFSTVFANGTNNTRLDSGTHSCWGGKTWCFMTVVVDRGNNLMSMYINGIYINGKTIPATGSVANAFNLTLGSLHDGSTRFFNGSIDEVRMWNRSLSAGEINQIYMSNLQKYSSTQWYLYVNQSNSSTTGLELGNYTYFASAKDSAGNENITETRTLSIISGILGNCWTKTGNILYIPTGCVYQLNRGSIYEI